MDIGTLNTLEDFLKDDSFIRYVLGESMEDESAWKTFCKRCPESEEIFEEAKSVLLAPLDVDAGISLSEKQELKDRIFESLKVEVDY